MIKWSNFLWLPGAQRGVAQPWPPEAGQAGLPCGQVLQQTYRQAYSQSLKLLSCNIFSPLRKGSPCGLYKIIFFCYPIWNVPWKCMIFFYVWILLKNSEIYLYLKKFHIFFFTFFYRWQKHSLFYTRIILTGICDRSFCFWHKLLLGAEICSETETFVLWPVCLFYRNLGRN